MDCPFCGGLIDQMKDDWVILMDGPDDRVVAHKDCIFDRPREEAPCVHMER